MQWWVKYRIILNRAITALDCKSFGICDQVEIKFYKISNKIDA